MPPVDNCPGWTRHSLPRLFMILVPHGELKRHLATAMLAGHAGAGLGQRIVVAELRDQAVEIENDELATALCFAGGFEPHAVLADATKRPARHPVGPLLSH